MRKPFSTDIVKKLKSIHMPALIYNNFIIRIVRLTEKEIFSIIPNIYIKPTVSSRLKSSTQKTIYGYNVNTKEYEKFDRLVKCDFKLTGQRFKNKSTINKRLDKDILYYGYYLKTRPFKK